MNQVAHIQQQPGALATLANRLNIDPQEVQNIVISTLMKAKGNNQQVSNEEFVTFLAIASEYKLNPLTKEVYAFSNRGAIQPIVSIDGWLKIINTHPQFDGMEFTDNLDADGRLASVTCKIYRKDRNRPTEVTEYMNECAGTSEPWKKWPARMLRHKATIQCARYAFGLSGIVDPDEAERIESVVGAERDTTLSNERPALEYYPAEQFSKDIKKHRSKIESGERSHEELINHMSTRFALTSDQEDEIRSIKVITKGEE